MSSNLEDPAMSTASNVISFAAYAEGRPRRILGYDEPRGEVLLFTGIRYERAADGDPSAPNVSNGSRPNRRRRRG
jgi:hypothetical protein